MSPHELLAAAKQKVPSINLATVYRAVNRLAEKGDVAVVELPGEPPRYELREAAEHHHHHFRCDVCQRVYDIPGCVHGLNDAAPPGFNVRAHEVVLFGTCPDCNSSDRRPARTNARRSAGRDE